MTSHIDHVKLNILEVKYMGTLLITAYWASINNRKQNPFSRFCYNIIKHKYLFILLLPGLLHYLIFRYFPMYGLLLAFKRYDVNVGILRSPWTIKYIKQVVTMPGVLQVVRNTVRISLLKIIFGFPAPIILALLLNELKNGPFKRIVQTITYMPHFLSWVVVAGLITDILSIEGPLAYIRHLMGLQPIVYLVSKQYFIPIVIISSIWKVGWGNIIYLATMSIIRSYMNQLI